MRTEPHEEEGSVDLGELFDVGLVELERCGHGGRVGVVQRDRADAADRDGGAGLGFGLLGRELVRDLPLSRRQMVEIAKALGRRPRLLILDEATSALTSADVAKVYDILKRLLPGLSVVVDVDTRDAGDGRGKSHG